MMGRMKGVSTYQVLWIKVDLAWICPRDKSRLFFFPSWSSFFLSFPLSLFFLISELSAFKNRVSPVFFSLFNYYFFLSWAPTLVWPCEKESNVTRSSCIIKTQKHFDCQVPTRKPQIRFSHKWERCLLKYTAASGRDTPAAFGFALSCAGRKRWS